MLNIIILIPFEKKYFPGIYVVKSELGLHVTKNIDRYSDFIETLPFNTEIEIQKVQKNPAENRIRGQLTNGHWVSIESTNNGYIWTIPRDYDVIFFKLLFVKIKFFEFCQKSLF